MKKKQNISLWAPSLNIIAVGMSASALLLLDILSVALFSTSPYHPLGSGATVALFGGHAVVQLCLCLLTGGGALVSRVMHQRFEMRRLSPASLGAAVMGGATAPFFFAVGKALTTGDWISAQPFAVYLPLVSGAVGGAGVAALERVNAVFPATGDRRGTRWVTASFAGAVVALSSLDSLVLCGLYDPLHYCLYFLSAYMAWRFSSRLVGASLRSRSPRFIGGAAAFILLAVVTATTTLLLADRSVRSELLNKSRTAAMFFVTQTTTAKSSNHLMTVLKRIRRGRDVADGYPRPRPQHPIKRSDWNIVLVVVDAMRADVLKPWRRRGQAHARDGDTPTLDRWIEKAFRFRFAYSQANVTEKSIPSLFRSVPSARWKRPYGLSLPEHMIQSGLTPMAVVNELFAAPDRGEFNRLLEGFEYIDIYDHGAQYQQLPKLTELVREIRPHPFFAWLHLYCLHNPYFDGERVLRSKGGSFPAHYREGVRWLDGEMGRLFETLERLGVEDDTVVVLTADHGEGLGAHGLNTHGSYVLEEEVRVPLAIYIPGMMGREIPATVGNIDILPTLLDLLGAPPDPNHFGRSLVPLMVSDNVRWNPSYYLENSTKNREGVVQGRDKLRYRSDADVLSRFDLLEDPGETTDIYTGHHERDQYLLAQLINAAPDLFAHELKNANTRAYLKALLDDTAPARPDNEVMLLVRIAAQSRDEDLLSAVLRRFGRVPDPDMKAQIAGTMFETHRKTWSGAIASTLRDTAGSRRELRFVRRLAAYHLPKLLESTIAGRMSWWLNHGASADLEPWLMLVHPWNALSSRHFKPVLMQFLSDTAPETRPLSIAFALGSLSRLSEDTIDGGRRAGIGEVARRFLGHDNVSVQAAACRVLERLRDKAYFKVLANRVKDPRAPALVKAAAMSACDRIDAAAAAPLIRRYGKETLPTLRRLWR